MNLSEDLQSAESLRQEINALRQRIAELEASQQPASSNTDKDKLEVVLNTIAEGVAMMDAAKKIVYVNPAFVLLTNYTLAEAQTITFDTLFEFAAGDEQTQAAAFARGEVWSGEVKGVRRDGYVYPTILTIVPMLDGDGRLTGYVSSQQDISRFKALDKAQYSFITNVSHQLRTPLTNIKLYSQLLEDNFNDSKAVHYLDVLNKEAKRLEHLVQDILELNSLDSSENRLEWRPVHMTQMILQISEAYQAMAEANQQKLRCTIHEGRNNIMGDAIHLRRAVTELLDNALAYTPAGGTISLEIAAPIQENRQWVKITVQDDGPGISTGEQDRVFERFFRGEVAEQGDIAGTGLGLCITQQIVQAHRGYLEMQTESGVGTSFTIWLPTDIF